MQAPGGTGKTKTFISICRSANERGRATIILTERVKVYEQAANESGGIRIGDGIKWVDVKPGKLYVAMAQTLQRRPKIIEQFNSLDKEVVVIVDECHISTSKSVLDQLHNRITLGFTATPDYRIAKHLPIYYNDIICSHPVQWFIDHNPPYLCDYQHIIRKSGDATNSIKKKNGDFSEFEQRKFFGTENHYQELFQDLNNTPFNKCMFFTASIKHAEECYTRLTEQGFKCSIAHSKRQDEPYQIAQFQSLHETNILISVGSLTTGYDYPDVDLIVLYRATTSLALYLQMIFRADRPKEGMFFRVLDYGSNGKRHKAYNYPHPWHKMWKEKPKKEKEGIGGIKLCPECESMLFVAATKCPYCGHVLPGPKQNDDVGQLEDITNKKLIISGRKVSELSPKELSLYANLYDKKSFAARIARSQEQTTPGWLNEYAKVMGYKDGWVYQQKQMINEKPIEFVDIKI